MKIEGISAMAASAVTELRTRLENCSSLPSLPGAAVEILRLSRNDLAGVDKLAEIIANDPALSSKLLRTVNSGLYGLSQKVGSVRQATALLGMRAVKNLALSFSLVQGVRKRQSSGFDHVRYWRRSLYAATAARVLAARLAPESVEDAFITGLLMDLGMLVLDQVLGEAYGVVHAQAATHADLAALETRSFGMTHAEAGGVLARHWKLPDSLTAAMEFHHDAANVSDPAARRLCEVASAASLCASVFADPAPALGIVAVRKALHEAHQWPDSDGDTLLREVAKQAAPLAPLFEVKLNSPTEHENLLAQASEKLLELALNQRLQPAQNRRKNERIRREGKVTITLCNDGASGATVIVQLCDISVAGVGVAHTEPIEVGRQFTIQLPQPGGTTKSLRYTVRSCRPAGPLHQIGAELTGVVKSAAAS